MIIEEQQKILDQLDWERQTVLYPGVTRIRDGGVVRDVSGDGTSAEIAYSSSTEDEVNQMIRREIAAARRAGYTLEWKVYGHDQPSCLGERLLAAGFEAEALEQFLVFAASPAALEQFGPDTADIRRVTTREGLRAVQIILDEVRGRSCAAEIAQYGAMLDNHPDQMSVYVAYVEGEPAACGRIYFHTDSKFGALYGGNTRERFRKRGLFTHVVAARIREALSRGIDLICVDALPTSEPILAKRGFEKVTYTQPYCLPA